MQVRACLRTRRQGRRIPWKHSRTLLPLPDPRPVPPDFILRPRQISKATFPIREAPPKDDAVEHPEASQEVGEKVRELKGETRTDAQQAGAVVHIGPGGPLSPESEDEEEARREEGSSGKGLLSRLGCGYAAMGSANPGDTAGGHCDETRCLARPTLTACSSSTFAKCPQAHAEEEARQAVGRGVPERGCIARGPGHQARGPQGRP